MVGSLVVSRQSEMIKPTTDALRQAAERLLKDKQAALQLTEVYKSKLTEANAYVTRLETAYKMVSKNNAGLRCKCDSDDQTVRELKKNVDKLQCALKSLGEQATTMQLELKNTDHSRTELMRFREGALQEIEMLKHNLKNSESMLEETSTRLSEALVVCEKAKLMEKQLADTIETSQMTSVELQSTKQKLSKCQKHADELLTEFEKEKNRHQVESTDLQGLIEEALANVAQLNRALQEKEACVHDISAQIAAIKSSKNELEETLAAKCALVADLQGTLNATIAEYNVAKCELEDLKRTMEETTANSCALRTQIYDLQSKIEADAATHSLALDQLRVEAASQLATQLKAAIDGGEQKLAQERERISAELEYISKSHRSEIESISGEKDALREAANNLRDDLRVAGAREEALDKQKGELELRLDGHTETIRQLEAKLAASEADHKRVHERAAAADAATQASEVEVARLREELNHTQAALAHKSKILAGISAVAGDSVQEHSSPSGSIPPGSALKRRRSPTGPSFANERKRTERRVRFSDVPSATQKRSMVVEAEEDMGDSPVDESRALVLPGHTHATKNTSYGAQRAFLVEEVYDDDEGPTPEHEPATRAFARRTGVRASSSILQTKKSDRSHVSGRRRLAAVQCAGGKGGKPAGADGPSAGLFRLFGSFNQSSPST